MSQTERASYELRTGHRIVAETRSGGVVPATPSARYLPATLVTGIPPLSTAGLDLRRISGIEAALNRPQTAYRVAATPLVRLPDGTLGLFLV